MGAMGRVRRLRDIVWWVAWIELGYAILTVVVSLTPILRIPPEPFAAPDAGTKLSSIVGFGALVFTPVGTFVAWGVLTALCEIHDLLRGEEEDDLDDFDEAEDDATG